MFWNKVEKREVTDGFDWTAWIKSEDYMSENALKQQDYLSALNILGNSIAKLPILVKQTTERGEIEATNYYLWDLLRLRPNSNMNSFECMKSLIMLYKNNGMAGLYIDRDFKGKVKNIYPVRIDSFDIDDVGLIKSSKDNKVLVNFTCVDVQGYCFDKDIVILRDNSLDGIHSKATKSLIKDTITTNLKAQAYQNSLFSNGLTSKIIVQLSSDIKEEKEMKKMQDKFDRLYKAKSGIFTVPAGYNVQSLNMDLASSQFAELKLLGKKDIANAVGIPFSLLDVGSLTEQENISYLTNTISPIITALEQEFDYKLLGLDRKKGYKIRFNVNSMLRVSAETQKNIIIDYVKNGIYSLEYARTLLGVDYNFENETVTLPSGQILLKDLINGKATWQKGNDSNSEGGDNNNGK
ncbi:phage portal protein [Clostridium beijerinckii]|uniref:phage portal protein n=1 Tax=Clostridium beijerinckii TaxID=1520 RepID=UPI00098CE67D|nr:phage portal protein [Clostridium beijerinckii]MBA8935906.1 HK97 family phage portal protein [Clostridium beijerinckii]NRU35978.1 HK97 family phage portal protein [Clostridium beijerinckii]NSB00741.1 HK97 family phage portal protein [Clostridium beijerinckii]OOM53867.1 phage portal protein [Clostridium beijerinckii]OOM66980.1 phage portal protein [Clostridium beijerinckii]